MAFFITKKRRAKHIQLLLDKERLEQRIKEVNNKNNFFRKENAELRNKLKIAEQLLEERAYKLETLNKELEITRKAIKSAESALEKREEETKEYFEKLMSIRNFIEKNTKV